MEYVFDKDKFAKLVERAKGKNRTAQSFAEELGVSPSTITRILNKKNSGPSKDDLLMKISDAAEPGSRVTLDALRKANGFGVNAALTIRRAYEFENGCREVISKSLIQHGVKKDEIFNDYQNGTPADHIFDLCVKSEKYGNWAFDFKIDTGKIGPGTYHKWVLMMMGIFYLGGDVNKISLVLSRREMYEQMKGLLDNVEIPDTISVILVNLNTKEVIEEYCTGHKYGLWRIHEQEEEDV